MSLNDAITKLINDRIDQFIAKIAEKYPNVDISIAKGIWENISDPESPEKEISEKTKDSPKRSKTAYMFFCAEKRPILKKRHSALTVGEINKMLGGMWEIEKDSISNDFKRFEEMAKKEKEKPEKEEGKKCTEILKTGKNKGSECGKPVKENGMCGRHLSTANKSDDEKNLQKQESKDTQEIEAEISKEKLVENKKCNFILQGGKNKGNECGKPVKENGMCGRHLKLVQEYEIEKRGEKISNLTQSMRENGKNREADDKTVKMMREEKSNEKIYADETDKLLKVLREEKIRKNPPQKYQTFDIEELDKKLTELYLEKIGWIIVKNMDPEKMMRGKDKGVFFEKKFNYYIISGLEDGLYYIECEMFQGEIELVEGGENTKKIIVDNLSNVDEFYTVGLECGHTGLRKIVKGLPRHFQ